MCVNTHTHRHTRMRAHTEWMKWDHLSIPWLVVHLLAKVLNGPLCSFYEWGPGNVLAFSLGKCNWVNLGLKGVRASNVIGWVRAVAAQRLIQQTITAWPPRQDGLFLGGELNLILNSEVVSCFLSPKLIKLIFLFSEQFVCGTLEIKCSLLGLLFFLTCVLV